MKIVVAIVTRGRPGAVRSLLERLEAQTRPPDAVFLSATCGEDLEGVEATCLGAGAKTVFGSAGVAAQRNRTFFNIPSV